jgi:hypothetical protein
MSSIRVRIEQRGEETQEACSCCGRPVYLGHGVLASERNDLANYWYRWSEGHDKRFVLAIRPCNERGTPGSRVAVVSGRVESENLVYSLVDPQDSPWSDSNEFGSVLSRASVLEGPLAAEVFALVDAITENERRLSSRILEPRHEA